MNWHVNILRAIAITCIAFLYILFLPLFTPVAKGISILFTDFLKFFIPELFFLIILFLLFTGIGALTSIKYAGWIPFVILIQELYLIGFVLTDFNLAVRTKSTIYDFLQFGFIIALLCVIYLECCSRLSAISRMGEIIPVYQEDSSKLSNYINKVQERFLNVSGKLNFGRQRYRHSPSIEYLSASAFAITLSSFVFYLIATSQIVGRRYPYLVVGILLPIVVLTLGLQNIKRRC